MPGLVPGIHVLAAKKGVDGRDKPAEAEFLSAPDTGFVPRRRDKPAMTGE